MADKIITPCNMWHDHDIDFARQWRQRVSNIGGTTSPFPSLLLSLPLSLPPPHPSPTLPLEVGPP